MCPICSSSSSPLFPISAVAAALCSGYSAHLLLSFTFWVGHLEDAPAALPNERGRAHSHPPTDLCPEASGLRVLHTCNQPETLLNSLLSSFLSKKKTSYSLMITCVSGKLPRKCSLQYDLRELGASSSILHTTKNVEMMDIVS